MSNWTDSLAIARASKVSKVLLYCPSEKKKHTSRMVITSSHSILGVQSYLSLKLRHCSWWSDTTASLSPAFTSSVISTKPSLLVSKTRYSRSASSSVISYTASPTSLRNSFFPMSASDQEHAHYVTVAQILSVSCKAQQHQLEQYLLHTRLSFNE